MRQSNFELLRIVSMLMVVNLHTFFAPDTLSFEDLTLMKVLDYTREASSISAVNIFVMISGYFSINWRIRSFSSLIFQLFFWVFLLYLSLLCVGFIDFSLKEFCIRVNCIATAYWFVTAYIGLYLLAPMLNLFVDSMFNAGGRKCLYFILAFFALQFYYQFLGVRDFFMGYAIISLCGIYMIGRYIKLTNLSLSKFKTLFGYVFVTLLIALVAIIGTFGGKNMFFYNNPLVVIQAIFIFLFFKQLKIQSSIVNYCSSSVLAIYLLHMHPDIKQYFYDYSNSLYAYSPLIHIMYLLMIFFLVFIVAIPLDKIRIILFDWIYNLIVGNKNEGNNRFCSSTVRD